MQRVSSREENHPERKPEALPLKPCAATSLRSRESCRAAGSEPGLHAGAAFAVAATTLTPAMRRLRASRHMGRVPRKGGGLAYLVRSRMCSC